MLTRPQSDFGGGLPAFVRNDDMISTKPKSGAATVRVDNSTMQRSMLKLCVGASSGGHMTELNSLIEVSNNWSVKPGMMITTLEFGPHAKNIPHYVLGECNRNSPFAAVKVFCRSFAVVLKERPDVVLTTGAMPLAIFAVLAKLFGARIIWIDSIAQIDRVSLSGRLIMPLADKFYVQWPQIADQYEDAIYRGELI